MTEPVTVHGLLFSLRNVLLADPRLAAPHARQLPYSRAGGIEVAVDVSVDHARPPGLDGFAHRVGELRRAAHAHAVDARRLRHRGEIRVVGLARAGVLEIGG